MRLCIGTSKGIVILNPQRGRTPSMVLADPSSVSCMAQDCRDLNLIYAGAVDDIHMGSARGRGSLARSTDGGRTWVDITPGLARDEDVWAIATPSDAPGEVFIGTSHARLLRSDNSGRSFSECTAFLRIPGRDRWTFPPSPHISHVRSITFDPENQSTIYVGVEEGGVFRSRDGGETFESLNHGIDTDVHCVAVDPEDSNRLYATTGGGFYLSEDAGRRWQRVTLGLNRSYTVPLLVGGRTGEAIYTAAAAGPPPTWSTRPAGADTMLFRSTDHGWSFKPIPANSTPSRGMVMRLIPGPGEAEGFIGALTDGSIIRASGQDDDVAVLADKLPPAYDLVVVP
jgi:hypothetical protein